MGPRTRLSPPPPPPVAYGVGIPPLIDKHHRLAVAEALLLRLQDLQDSNLPLVSADDEVHFLWNEDRGGYRGCLPLGLRLPMIWQSQSDSWLMPAFTTLRLCLGTWHP